MTPEQAYDLIKRVQADYLAMVRELNKLKKPLVKVVDPWDLPLVQDMQKALKDLQLAGGKDMEKMRKL